MERSDKMPEKIKLELEGTDKKELRMIRATINRIVEDHGTQTLYKLLTTVNQHLYDPENDIKEDGSLYPDEVIRGIARERKIKQHNVKDYVEKGRKNKVEHYFKSFKEYFEEGSEYWCAKHIYEVRKRLSRTSFWRFRKQVEEEFGFDPVEEYKDIQVNKTKMSMEELGDKKS